MKPSGGLAPLRRFGSGADKLEGVINPPLGVNRPRCETDRGIPESSPAHFRCHMNKHPLSKTDITIMLLIGLSLILPVILVLLLLS